MKKNSLFPNKNAVIDIDDTIFKLQISKKWKKNHACLQRKPRGFF